MTDAQPKAPLPGEKPANLHQRLTTSADDEEVDPLVEQLGGGCGKLYAQLEVGDSHTTCLAHRASAAPWDCLYRLVPANA